MDSKFTRIFWFYNNLVIYLKSKLVCSSQGILLWVHQQDMSHSVFIFFTNMCNLNFNSDVDHCHIQLNRLFSTEICEIKNIKNYNNILINNVCLRSPQCSLHQISSQIRWSQIWHKGDHQCSEEIWTSADVILFTKENLTRFTEIKCRNICSRQGPNYFIALANILYSCTEPQF